MEAFDEESSQQLFSDAAETVSAWLKGGCEFEEGIEMLDCVNPLVA